MPAWRAGDHPRGDVYVYDPDVVLAVNVALTSRRPLLVGGPPGAGKSSLAFSVAQKLGWRYLEEVVSSRTRGVDLLWRFDAVARLHDAQADQFKTIDHYIDPGVLWQAFDASSSALLPRARADGLAADTPAVVLLDEIDKADPDVPNDLLVPLGALEFHVPDLGMTVRATEDRAPFMVITTNDERQLSRAFLRRCVILNLKRPSTARLADIARAHFGPRDDGLYIEVAEIVEARSAEADQRAMPVPSTAEYLDTLEACIALDIRKGSAQWDLLLSATLDKRVEPGGSSV